MKFSNNTPNILLWVSHHFNVDVSDITSKKRDAYLIKPRAMCCALMRLNKENLQTIGICINRNHASVMHLLKRHDDFLKTNAYAEIFIELSRFSDKNNARELINFYQNQINKLIKLL